MISQDEYKARRQRLAAQLPEHSIAIIAAAQEITRNGDTHFRFRQDSNFYYLTGFNEPDAVLLISSGSNTRSILLNRPRHLEQEQWTGPRLGQEGACTELLMDSALPINSLEDELPKLLAGYQSIYYLLGKAPKLEQQIIQAINQLKALVRRGVQAPECLVDLAPLLGEMRLIKSEAEIALMRQAAKISVSAHQQAMRCVATARMEYEVEAELLYYFSRQGCRSTAYDSIVGSGKNACVLHYTDNNQPLCPGELLLIDAGGEYGNYASDITRTFPINGTFTPEQRSIYDLVLKAQRAGIAAIKPGVAWNSIQTVIVRIITQGLCELGLLHGDVDALIGNEAYKPFYMHQSGHWLGLDVHDAGQYKINGQWRPLVPGMVLTVEPGLYISQNIPGIDPRWWNIGIRIEDDVLVTNDGFDVLTADLIVDADEIEAFMRD